MADWTFSPQDGGPGHCHMAQVWDESGKCIAVIEPTDDATVANSRAALLASAPELLEALKWLVAEHRSDNPLGRAMDNADTVIAKAEGTPTPNSTTLLSAVSAKGDSK